MGTAHVGREYITIARIRIGRVKPSREAGNGSMVGIGCRVMPRISDNPLKCHKNKRTHT